MANLVGDGSHIGACLPPRPGRAPGVCCMERTFAAQRMRAMRGLRVRMAEAVRERDYYRGCLAEVRNVLRARALAEDIVNRELARYGGLGGAARLGAQHNNIIHVQVSSRIVERLLVDSGLFLECARVIVGDNRGNVAPVPMSEEPPVVVPGELFSRLLASARQGKDGSPVSSGGGAASSGDEGASRSVPLPDESSEFCVVFRCAQ